MALPKAWSYIRSNSSIIYLGLGQSCFEVRGAADIWIGAGVYPRVCLYMCVSVDG